MNTTRLYRKHAGIHNRRKSEPAAAADHGLFAGDERIDVYPAPGSIESDVAVHQGENGVIAPESHVLARHELRSALANDNVAGYDRFAAKTFHTQPIADAIATVFDTALSFFMSHGELG